MSTFNPLEHKYVPFVFEKEMDIAKAASTATQNQAPLTPKVFTETADGENNHNKTDSLLYLKSNITSKVLLPLERNAFLLAFIMIGASVIFLIISILVAVKRHILEKDPAIKKRIQARALKRGIITKLKASPPEEMFDRTSEELDSFLTAMLDLPRGTSLAECAEILKKDSPELAECLAKLSETSWNPTAKGEFNEIFKTRFIKALSKFGVFAVILFACASLRGAETNQEAMTAYDTGDFKTALTFYADKIRTDGPSAPLLYNLGNCYYKTGNLPMALAAYERALRLAPRSSDITENLNLTRRQLMLEEKRLLDSPRDFPSYIRDSLRLDEWLVLAAFGLAASFTALGLAVLKIRKRVWLGILTGGIAIGTLSIIMTFMQMKYTYTEKYAAVVERNAPLYSLPSASGKVELSVKAGTECTVSEKRSDFVRVTIDGAEGWMKTSALVPLWSEKTSDLGDLY